LGAFRSGRTSLTVPSSVEAGVPFDLCLSVTNESDARVIGGYVLLEMPAVVTLQMATLTLDGRQHAALVMSSHRAQIPLLPLAPHATASISCKAFIAPLPEGNNEVALGVNVVDRHESLALEARVRVDARALFTREGTVVDLGGFDTICQGEMREVCIVVYNEGTATAVNVVADYGMVGLKTTDGAHAKNFGNLAPGAMERIVFDVECTGEMVRIRPALYCDGKLVLQLDEAPIRLIQPARFSSRYSRLTASSEELVAPMGGTAKVVLSVMNEGDLPAEHVTVNLHVSEGASVVSEPTPSVTLHNVLEGQRRDYEFTIRVDGRNDVQVTAEIEGGPVLEPLAIEVAASTSFAIYGFEADHTNAEVERPFDVALNVMNDGNTRAKSCAIVVKYSQGLTYDVDSLEINGLRFDDSFFRDQGFVGVTEIESGALIALRWKALPTKPTLGGKRASISAIVHFEHDMQIEKTIEDIGVNPRAVVAKHVSDLPFRLVGYDQPLQVLGPKQVQLSTTKVPFQDDIPVLSIRSREVLPLEEFVPHTVSSNGHSNGHSTISEPSTSAPIEADPLDSFPDIFTSMNVFGSTAPSQSLEQDAIHVSEHATASWVEPEPAPESIAALQPEATHSYEEPSVVLPIVHVAERIAGISAVLHSPERRIKLDTQLTTAHFTEPIPLMAHISAIRAFLPDALVSDDARLCEAYKDAAGALSALMMLPMIRYKRDGDISVAPSSLEAFANKAEPFASRLANTPDTPLRGYDSAWVIPSVGACLAALASCGPLGFASGTEEQNVVASYTEHLIERMKAMDSIDLHRYADALGQTVWVADLDDEYLATRRFLTQTRVEV